MADAFTRAARDPLRPARLFAPIFAVGAVAFLALAIFGATTAAGASPDVVASGTGGRLVLPEGTSGDLVVYSATTSGAEPDEDVRCELEGSSRAGFDSGSGTVEVDGQVLFRNGDVNAGWSPGDVLTCAGSDGIAVTSGSGAAGRVGLAALGGFGFLVSTVLAVVGFTSRRSRVAHP